MEAQFLFELGDEVKDRITEQRGIVTARTEHLFGCARYWLEPRELKDGKPVDGRWIDEDALVLVASGVIQRRRYRVHQVEDMPAPPIRRAAGGPTDQPRSDTRASER